MKDEGFDTAFVRVSQIYAGVGTSLDDAHGFKGSQCFADSAAAGVEFLCEVSLRWKTFRRLIAALPDEREDFASGVRGGAQACRFDFVVRSYVSALSGLATEGMSLSTAHLPIVTNLSDVHPIR